MKPNLKLVITVRKNKSSVPSKSISGSGWFGLVWGVFGLGVFGLKGKHKTIGMGSVSTFFRYKH